LFELNYRLKRWRQRYGRRQKSCIPKAGDGQPFCYDNGADRHMRAKIVKGIKWVCILVAITAIIFFGIRVYDVQRGPQLERWHTYVPHELRAKELDAAD